MAGTALDQAVPTLCRHGSNVFWIQIGMLADLGLQEPVTGSLVDRVNLRDSSPMGRDPAIGHTPRLVALH